MAAKEPTVVPRITRASTGKICIIGLTPLIINRISDHSAKELLCPSAKKNAREKKTTLKHDVIREYRDSVYCSNRGDTEVVLPTCAFKAALMSAALDVNGTSKSSIGRTVYVQGDEVPVYGVPRLLMSTVRNSDINKTPDIRTRSIFEEWATVISVNYTSPLVTQENLINLLLIAGSTIGVGDWRQEKGKGNHGCFAICEPDDPDFLRIRASSTREAQAEALANPTPYDLKSAELLSFFLSEAARRDLEHTV